MVSGDDVQSVGGDREEAFAVTRAETELRCDRSRVSGAPMMLVHIRHPVYLTPRSVRICQTPKRFRLMWRSDYPPLISRWNSSGLGSLADGLLHEWIIPRVRTPTSAVSNQSIR